MLARLPSGVWAATTIYDRFRRWSRQGVWFAVFEPLTGHSGACGSVAIDSTSIEVHRSAAGAKGERLHEASAPRAVVRAGFMDWPMLPDAHASRA